jgi:hypothetical protein
VGYGKYHPYPRRFGGNKYEGKPLLEVLNKSIDAQRGAAFDTEDGTTVVAIENHAFARALAYDGWEVNARLGMQSDPTRTTDMLSRWETIFKIRPSPTATDKERRDELALRWARFGELANHAELEEALQVALGDYFYAVEYISLANAVVHVPDGTYPWGTVVDGIAWYSTVAHILVRVQKPTGATEADFYEHAGKVVTTLDPIVNAFVTFDWYREPESTPINVSGGPSAGGFYLDDEHNLDNNVFDV